LILPRYRRVLAALIWAVAAQAPAQAQGQQAEGQQPGSTPGHGQPAAPPAKAPDDEFIEFLGEDDHGDAAWWEFLKRTSPGAHNPAPPPPQGSKQS
jgi:hypothetical protein